jgi:hypothetical protein
MGKGSSSPPAAPDPKVTIQAQSEANADTARLEAKLNRVNQVGPTGSITYSQGQRAVDPAAWENEQVAAERARVDAANKATMAPYTYTSHYDEAGQPVTVTAEGPGAQVFDEAAYRASLAGKAPTSTADPDQWVQTTQLSPEQQRLYDLTTSGQTTYGETANALLKNVQADLSKPVDFKVDTDWEGYRQKALDAQRSRLDPDYARAEEGLRQRLINSGLTAGSEGWQREMDQLLRGRNDALLQADLRAGDLAGQGINQQGALLQQTAALRGMPLNEASALLSGGQVQVPQLQNVAQTNVAPTDALGAYNTQHQSELNAYNQQQKNNSSALGGLFGLAGTLGGASIGKWG